MTSTIKPIYPETADPERLDPKLLNPKHLDPGHLDLETAAPDHLGPEPTDLYNTITCSI